MLTPRKTISLTCWPDPLLQERVEDIGFFYDTPGRAWIRFCDEDELEALGEWLKRHALGFRVTAAGGRGETRKHAKLSDQLRLKDGGSPKACALCGATNTFCRQWIEGDDTDSIEYPDAARFFLCGRCVQEQMQPHPRLYAAADDQL